MRTREHTDVSHELDAAGASASVPPNAAEEQAALHRIARLVAQETSPDAVLRALAEEAGRLLGAAIATIDRFDPDDMVTLMTVQGATAEAPIVGSQVPVAETGNTARVYATGAPARVDHYTSAFNPTGHRSGFRAAISVPITVGGCLWGAMTVAATSNDVPFPSDTELRLAAFAELASLAIANAQAREELTAVAAEQAALRRVATLVASGARPEAVFGAVSEELARLLGADAGYVLRHEPDGMVTAVGIWSPGRCEIVKRNRMTTSPLGLAQTVLRNGQTTRADMLEGPAGSFGGHLRADGLTSGIASPIRVQDQLWGLTAVATAGPEPLPRESGRQLEAFTELVALAIAGAQTRAELAASRARVLASGDETRRKIERDLHDGAQQRLVALALELRAAEREVPPEHPELANQLHQVSAGLAATLDELREFAHGIHPAILRHRGLEPALRSLARRARVPVELSIEIEARLPDPVAATAYFIVAEALTNAAKHAQAGLFGIDVRAGKRVLRLTVRDDGIGGADSSRGSGLVGLRDRVEAAGGTLHIRSPRGEGTELVAELPLQLGSDPAH